MAIHKGPRLYGTNDGRIVAEGDTEAAFLVVGEGGTIPPEHTKAVKAYMEANPVPDTESATTRGDSRAAADDDGDGPVSKPARATKRAAGPSEDK